MNKKGPIILIEDDLEDQELIQAAFRELDILNQIICFTKSDNVIDYLSKATIKPFLILSDIAMHPVDGLKIRDRLYRLNNEFRGIPYLFFTTYNDQEYVIDAFSDSVQGYFIKPNSYQELIKILKTIVTYWSLAEPPCYKK